MKILKEVPFLERIHLAMISMEMRRLMYQEKSLKDFDLSPFCIIEDDFISMIDQMCPTIKHVKLQGNNLDLWINQTIGDIILPFRFLHSLTLSRCPAVDTLKFLWQAPITLKQLVLDFLFVPADEFVRHVPVLSNQLTALSMTSNPQLTKFDLVGILQCFWKLEELNIVDSEYLTPGTCDTISRYCYNLEKFYFSLDFRLSDMRAWIGLLGIDLVHIEFTEVVKSNLKSYMEIEEYYQRQDDGYEFIDSD